MTVRTKQITLVFSVLSGIVYLLCYDVTLLSNEDFSMPPRYCLMTRRLFSDTMVVEIYIISER